MYLSMLDDVLCGRSTAAQLQEWMMEIGVNTFHGAVWRLPYLSLLAGCPMDIMHIFMEGVARQGMGALAFWLIRKCNVNPFAIPAAINKYAESKRLSRCKKQYLVDSSDSYLIAI